MGLNKGGSFVTVILNSDACNLNISILIIMKTCDNN